MRPARHFFLRTLGQYEYSNEARGRFSLHSKLPLLLLLLLLLPLLLLLLMNIDDACPTAVNTPRRVIWTQ